MYITKLYIRNFRNIREAELDFDKNLNIFVGRNAQGKTNLCEAVSVCLGGSFRRARFSQYIPADDPKAEVSVKLFFRDDITERENIIDYTVSKNIVSVKYNGIKMKDAAELYGVLKYVVFIPEHLNLIKGSPELRRDYLDDVALMQTKTHLKKLSRYNKGLKQRNNILSFNNGDLQSIAAQIAPWNEVLAAEGINVTYGRLKYFAFLKKCAGDIYSDLTDSAEKLSMEYNSSVFKTESINFNDIDNLYRQYMTALEKNLEAEMKLHYTLSGVHRDDAGFFINGLAARDFASQGQVRSVALALKLSEAEIIRRKNKTDPVIILDDILSELDSVRRDFVIHHIEKSQVFITCCNIDDLSSLSGGKVWTADGGMFTEVR
ncbi:MAG: DNA replication/repair protein RecF [Lachnospiraceae bacterium]|nr:DNA replication/repair protein RecF [Ruminococcus sp.]MCM1274787.1 DNA replication/repair protein RecF [Lachnospiraceae bacterium]